MNVALTLSQENKAMLVYDRPLGFIPSWVECSADGQGLRIIAGDGRALQVGCFYKEISDKLGNICDVLMVRMDRNEPVEGHTVPFIGHKHY